MEQTYLHSGWLELSESVKLLWHGNSGMPLCVADQRKESVILNDQGLVSAIEFDDE